MANAFLVFFAFQFKYTVGRSELLVGVSMISLLHLFSVLAKLSSTSSSSFAWVRSKIFRVLHQKYYCSLYKCRQGSIQKSPIQTKRIGKASSKNFLFKPEELAKLHPKISCSNQNDRRSFIQKSPVQAKMIGEALSKKLLFMLEA